MVDVPLPCTAMYCDVLLVGNKWPTCKKDQTYSRMNGATPQIASFLGRCRKKNLP